jgi:hypothetical protein
VEAAGVGRAPWWTVAPGVMPIAMVLPRRSPRLGSRLPSSGSTGSTRCVPNSPVSLAGRISSARAAAPLIMRPAIFRSVVAAIEVDLCGYGPPTRCDEIRVPPLPLRHLPASPTTVPTTSSAPMPTGVEDINQPDPLTRHTHQSDAPRERHTTRATHRQGWLPKPARPREAARPPTSQDDPLDSSQNRHRFEIDPRRLVVQDGHGGAPAASLARQPGGAEPPRRPTRQQPRVPR